LQAEFDPGSFSCYSNFNATASKPKEKSEALRLKQFRSGSRFHRQKVMVSPRSLLATHGLRPHKRLGQNFLADSSVAQKIVDRSQVGKEDVVLEIGAGLGALTIPLAMAARRVYAIEKDRRLGDILKEQLQEQKIPNVDVLAADILNFDLTDLARRADSQLTVFGNLPYNISSQVVIRLIDSRRYVERAVLMFQRELAARLTASPGGKEYGRITAMLAYCASAKHLCHVGRMSFFPPPQVNSEVIEIRFTAADRHPPHDETRLFRLIAAAFGKRRKTLKNALTASGLRISAHEAVQALEGAGIRPDRRAETLSPEEFVALEISLRELAPTK
jgi:16S rRNA (adenine1518-N6/adenine1519-N6)-dimethyltransferase